MRRLLGAEGRGQRGHSGPATESSQAPRLGQGQHRLPSTRRAGQGNPGCTYIRPERSGRVQPPPSRKKFRHVKHGLTQTASPRRRGNRPPTPRTHCAEAGGGGRRWAGEGVELASAWDESHLPARSLGACCRFHSKAARGAGGKCVWGISLVYRFPTVN